MDTLSSEIGTLKFQMGSLQVINDELLKKIRTLTDKLKEKEEQLRLLKKKYQDNRSMNQTENNSFRAVIREKEKLIKSYEKLAAAVAERNDPPELVFMH